MPIKILQLCLVLVSTFKVFVKFSLSSAAQLLKLWLQTKPSLKQIFRQYPFANMNLGFATYIVLTRNVTQYSRFKSTPSTSPLQHFLKILYKDM